MMLFFFRIMELNGTVLVVQSFLPETLHNSLVVSSFPSYGADKNGHLSVDERLKLVIGFEMKTSTVSSSAELI